MAKQFLYDLSEYDLDHVDVTKEQIAEVNPHRGDMALLDGIIWHNQPGEKLAAIGFKDITEDEFWVPGHIPGRPVYPGVLMIESAAQLASFLFIDEQPDTEFMGFTGCDAATFRGQVVPGDRLYILGLEIKRNRRRIVCYCQGVVDGKMVYEVEITGMPI